MYRLPRALEARWCTDFTDSLLTLLPLFSNSLPNNQVVKYRGGGRNCSTQTPISFKKLMFSEVSAIVRLLPRYPPIHWITGKFTGSCVDCKHSCRSAVKLTETTIRFERFTLSQATGFAGEKHLREAQKPSFRTSGVQFFAGLLQPSYEFLNGRSFQGALLRDC